MMGRSRKQLLKVADVFVSMPFNKSACEKANFEPLILAIVLPFFSRSPWKLKRAKCVREYEGNLQRMWSDNFLLGGNLLRKRFSVSTSLKIMSGDIVWEVL